MPCCAAPQFTTQIPGTSGLPLVSEEAAYWWSRALGVTARNPSRAILVSRWRFARLRPFRSWQDFGALRAYVEFADRPEAVGLRDNIVTANVSRSDLILLRIPAARVKAPVNQSAGVGRVPVVVRADPIGYAVLDPRRTGPVRITLQLRPNGAHVPALSLALPVAPVPFVEAALREGASVVVLYGLALTGRRIRVFSRRGEGTVLYSSYAQLNSRLPSLDEVAVEIDGLRSDWTPVQ